MYSNYFRKVITSNLFSLSLLLAMLFLVAACKKDLGKMNYPSSLVLGDVPQDNFFFQDSLGVASVFGASSDSELYNLDNIGSNEIEISVQNYFQTGFGSYSYVYLNTMTSNVEVLTDGNGEVAVLNASDTIATYSNNWQSGNFQLSLTDVFLNYSGAWNNQEEKYIGVKIAGAILGWMKISLTHPWNDFHHLVEVHEIGALN